MYFQRFNLLSLINQNGIRDRFVICLKEVSVNERLRDIAEKSGTSESYLSQLQKKQRKIPASIIANFCIVYHYSPTWILTGVGSMKYLIDRSEAMVKVAEQNRILLEALQVLKEIRDKTKLKRLE